MKFMGSKRRIAKHILPIILKYRAEGQLYVEPFVGGANSFERVENPRLGADNNRYLIACLSAVRDGWIPPSTVTEDEYKAIRGNLDEYPPELVGFVSFGCSFGSNWGSGYARNKRGVNYAAETMRGLARQSRYLAGATFTHSAYQDLTIPDDSIVYCDPPYAGTAKYSKGGFDHAAFWVWATELSKRCRVFVSEYTAPEGWECVWEMQQTTSINNKTGSVLKATEKLFTLAR